MTMCALLYCVQISRERTRRTIPKSHESW